MNAELAELMRQFQPVRSRLSMLALSEADQFIFDAICLVADDLTEDGKAPTESTRLRARSLLRDNGIASQPAPSVGVALDEIRLAWCSAQRTARLQDRVYFIQAEGEPCTPIKIGHTGNVPRRLTQLQACSPVRLTVLVDVPGGESLETFLHACFASWRLYGEWFAPSLELAQLINGAREVRESPHG